MPFTETLIKSQIKRQQRGLSENKDLAYLSKQLVTLKTDMQLEFTVDQTAIDFQKA